MAEYGWVETGALMIGYMICSGGTYGLLNGSSKRVVSPVDFVLLYTTTEGAFAGIGSKEW